MRNFLDFMKSKHLIESKEVSPFLDHYRADVAGSNPLMEEDQSEVVYSPGDNLLASLPALQMQCSEP
jgi:hypothetical protein